MSNRNVHFHRSAGSQSTQEYSKPVRVFVHLARDHDARQWERRWREGKIVGINDRLPYGYFRAAEHGCAIAHSQDKTRNKFERFLGSLASSVVGVDIAHAFRNRNGIYAADVVWTHTELQSLAVLLLFEILFWKPRPRLIAQSVWLMDRWPGLGRIKRAVVSRLLAKADVLTFLSPANRNAAEEIFPKIRCEFVPFGINTDDIPPLKRERAHRPIRILSVGNDPDRDWHTLIAAVRTMPNFALKIASKKVKPADVAGAPNIEVLTISSNEQLLAAFGWADILAVTLIPNLHASGITVIEEAAIRGLPIVATDTGGLRAYFPAEEIFYIPGGDPLVLRKAILTLAADDALRWTLAKRAQERMKSGSLSSRAYAKRHAELSREVLAAEAPLARPPRPPKLLFCPCRLAKHGQPSAKQVRPKE
jgi:glycosyltransferase involved in cell wall biosynthesis